LSARWYKLTSWPAFGTSSERKNTAFTIENTAAAMPIPSPREATAARVATGERLRLRIA
jgi:hypothetical protein